MNRKMEIPTISPHILRNKKRESIKNKNQYFLANKTQEITDNVKNDKLDENQLFDNSAHPNSLNNTTESQEIEKFSNKDNYKFNEFDDPSFTYYFSKLFLDPETVSFLNNASDSDDNSAGHLDKSKIPKKSTQNSSSSFSSDIFLSTRSNSISDKFTGASKFISFSLSAPSLFSDLPDSNFENPKKDNSFDCGTKKNYLESIILPENKKDSERVIENDKKQKKLKTSKASVNNIGQKPIISNNSQLDKFSNNSDELLVFSEGCVWGREGYPTMFDLDVSHISAYYQHNQYSDYYYNYVKSMNLKRLELVDCYILLGITLPKYRILKKSFKILECTSHHNSKEDNLQQCFSNLYFKNIKLDKDSQRVTDIICDSVILVVNANSASEFDCLINFNKSYESFFGKSFKRNPNPEKKTFVDLFTGKLNKVEDKMSIGCMCKYMFFPRTIDGSHNMTVDQMKKVIFEYKRFVTKLEYLINQVQVIINIIFEILNVPTYELDGTYESSAEKVNITWKARPKELRFAIVSIACKVLSRFVALNLDDWYIIISRFCYYRAQSVKRVYQRCFASKMVGNDEFSGNENECHKFAVKLANEFATRHFIDFQK